MSAIERILCDVAGAAVAGGGSLDVAAAVANVSAARAELAAMREVIARADALEESCGFLAVIESTEGGNSMIIGEQSLRSAMAAYRAARESVK